MKPHDALDDATGARPDPQARAGPGPGAQGLAAGAVGDAAAMAQRPGHARGAASAEDAGLAAAVPVSEPGPVRRGPTAGAGHAGGVVGRGHPHPRGAHRADRARRAGLHRRRRPGDLAGDLQRARTRAGQGLSGQRARRSAGQRRRLHAAPRRRRRRHRHRGVHRHHRSPATSSRSSRSGVPSPATPRA